MTGKGRAGRGALAAVLACLLLCSCGKGQQNKGTEVDGVQGAGTESSPSEGTNGSRSEEADDAQGNGEEGSRDSEVRAALAARFKDMSLTKSYKGFMDTNPIMTQRFGADPYAMVYGDRVYFYMTADAFEYDGAGEVVENTYGKIRSINVVSTADMVNFTDHGSIAVAGGDGAAKWAHNSWAPAAAWKEIDGKVKFFLYFADNGGGIGVLESDSPTGPFTDPLGKALISRQTPKCADVLWLFDPAVLVDDDGRAYLYFGGGVPEGRVADPGTARVVELGEDMVSIKGEPKVIDVPYLFEDSGIHKAGNKYYYTYCTNWQVDAAGTEKYGFHNAEIVSLESDSPMGPFTFKERILENPGTFCGLYGNNHHCVFTFQDRWYVTYHSRVLEKAMGVEHGYRCTNVDEFTMGEDGTIGIIRQTADGREQLKKVDPYRENSAVNMAMNAGLDTAPAPDGVSGSMVLTGVDNGDYLKVQGVDFGEKSPWTLEVWLKAGEGTDDSCGVCVRLDLPKGEAIVTLPLQESGETDEAGFVKCQAALEKEVTGVHDLYFLFSGSGYEVKSWRFSGDGCKPSDGTAAPGMMVSGAAAAASGAGTSGAAASGTGTAGTAASGAGTSDGAVAEPDCPKAVCERVSDRQYGTVEHFTYQSKTTGLEREANVLLPPGYSSDQEYPVLYFLHGIFGDENSMIGDGNNKIPEILGNLAAEGKAREMIVIFPNMYATSDPEQKPGFDSEAVAPYDNFINDLVNDLIPYVESHYAASSDKGDRAIIGFSMGGRESLFIGVSRPDLFCCIGAISPAPGLTPAKDWAMEHPGQMEESELRITDEENLPKLLLVCCGTKDGVVGKFPASYHETLEKNGTEHLWYEVPGADHNDQAIRSGLYNFVTRW